MAGFCTFPEISVKVTLLNTRSFASLAGFENLLKIGILKKSCTHLQIVNQNCIGIPPKLTGDWTEIPSEIRRKAALYQVILLSVFKSGSNLA